MSEQQLPGMPPTPLPPLNKWAVSVVSPDVVLEYDAVKRPLFDGSGNWVIIEPFGGGYVFVARDPEMVVTATPLES